MPFPPFDEQVRMLQAALERELPERLLDLFRPESPVARRLLPLATGREFDASDPGASPAEAYLEHQRRSHSVLGFFESFSAIPADDPDDVWPNGLLVIEDHGCAIYRAVDLEHPDLRVIEYECLEPNPDPHDAHLELAYGEPMVPKDVQHRFVVVARTLDEWVAQLSKVSTTRLHER